MVTKKRMKDGRQGQMASPPLTGILAMDMMFYAMWYKQDVSPHLSMEQKKALAMKLSDWSLEEPFWTFREVPLDKFPELKPYSNLPCFSGRQMYAVFCEVFNEVSETKIEPPYPRL